MIIDQTIFIQHCQHCRWLLTDMPVSEIERFQNRFFDFLRRRLPSAQSDDGHFLVLVTVQRDVFHFIYQTFQKFKSDLVMNRVESIFGTWLKIFRNKLWCLKLTKATVLTIIRILSWMLLEIVFVKKSMSKSAEKTGDREIKKTMTGTTIHGRLFFPWKR